MAIEMSALVGFQAVTQAAACSLTSVGPVGGALFGGVQTLGIFGFVVYIRDHTKKVVDEHFEKSIATIVNFALPFFVGAAAGWGALALAGFTLSFRHIALMTVLSMFTFNGLAFLVDKYSS